MTTGWIWLHDHMLTNELWYCFVTIFISLQIRYAKSNEIETTLHILRDWYHADYIWLDVRATNFNQNPPWFCQITKQIVRCKITITRVTQYKKCNWKNLLHRFYFILADIDRMFFLSSRNIEASVSTCKFDSNQVRLFDYNTSIMKNSI